MLSVAFKSIYKIKSNKTKTFREAVRKVSGNSSPDDAHEPKGSSFPATLKIHIFNVPNLRGAAFGAFNCYIARACEALLAHALVGGPTFRSCS
jgi:hypothetical protein